jgi:hypothetical protein
MRKYRADASIENQLKIDKLDQNHLQSIEKIQNHLHLTASVFLVLSSSLQKKCKTFGRSGVGTPTRSKMFWISTASIKIFCIRRS